MSLFDASLTVAVCGPIVAAILFQRELTLAGREQDPIQRINRWIRAFLTGRAVLYTVVTVLESQLLLEAAIEPGTDGRLALIVATSAATLSMIVSVLSWRGIYRVAGTTVREVQSAFQALHLRTLRAIRLLSYASGLGLGWLLIQTVHDVPSILFGYAAALAVLGPYVLFSFLARQYLLRQSSNQVEPRTKEIFEEVKATLGYSNARLLPVTVSFYGRGNAAYAIGRDTVSVTARFGVDLDEQEQRCVLGHEIGHLIRKDTVQRLRFQILWRELISILPPGATYFLWQNGSSFEMCDFAGFSLFLCLGTAFTWLSKSQLPGFRKAEFECDLYGLKASADIEASIRALTKISESFNIPLLAESDQFSHPALSQRIQALRDATAKTLPG